MLLRIIGLLFLLSFCVANAQTNNDLVLQYINDYRSQQHLNKLTMDASLAKIAQSHSQAMCDNDVPFGHANFEQRMKAVFSYFPGSWGIAENVVYTDANPASAVDLWLHSRGHRKNIEGNFNLTGIGSAYDKYGRVYITQIFLNAPRQAS